MKIKLTHLIIASLISLSFVFSSASNVFSGSRLLKVRNHYPNTTSGSGYSKKEDTSPNTTSASGFNEGPITPKHKGGPLHFDLEPTNYGVQPPLDLRLDMLRVNYEKVRVTVRNISSHNTNGLLWINFWLVNPDVANEGMSWSQTFDAPDPYQNMTTYIAFEPPQTNNGKGWRLHAWANYVGGEWQLDESNYSNNTKVICRYDEDCP